MLLSTRNPLCHTLQLVLFRRDVPIELHMLILPYFIRPISSAADLETALRSFHAPDDLPPYEQRDILCYGPIRYFDLSALKSFGCALQELVYFPADIEHWDTSSIENLDRCFMHRPDRDRRSAWPRIDRWDTSNVVSMRKTFYNCHDMNVPIGSWNTSKVVNFAFTFMSCYAFNQPLSNWSTASALTTRSMFHECELLNQSFAHFDMSNVTDSISMFSGCVKMDFDWPIGNWDVSQVKYMSGMFGQCLKFNAPLNGWNVSRVENFTGLFRGCVQFNQPLDQWKTDRAVKFTSMFEDCVVFNQPLRTWNVSKVVYMDKMFLGCRELHQSFLPILYYVIYGSNLCE